MTATERLTGNAYFQGVTNALSYVAQKGNEVIVFAQEPGIVQRTAQAGLRTVVGLYSITQFPYAAAVGGLAAAVKPEITKTGTSLIEGAISGIWKRMSFNQKVAVTAVGVASVSYFDPTLFFTVAGTIFSFKLGAEIGQRNLTREHVIHAELVAASEIEQQQ